MSSSQIFNFNNVREMDHTTSRGGGKRKMAAPASSTPVDLAWSSYKDTSATFPNELSELWDDFLASSFRGFSRAIWLTVDD